MRLLIEDYEIQISATEEEIKLAINYLQDILLDKVPNEVIFKQYEPFLIVRVEKE